jgi:hypothetical protein
MNGSESREQDKKKKRTFINRAEYMKSIKYP